ncbi:MAG: aspartate carbamoyltransferase regulatory subunit, partial [Eubacteriales bacterium]
MEIYKYLNLGSLNCSVAIIKSVKSDRLGRKDIIKIDSHLLTLEEIHKIALFAAGATINLIRDFSVFEKTLAQVPKTVKGILRCPNLNCVSR